MKSIVLLVIVSASNVFAVPVNSDLNIGNLNVETGDSNVDTADLNLDTGDSNLDSGDLNQDTGDLNVNNGDGDDNNGENIIDGDNNGEHIIDDEDTAPDNDVAEEQQLGGMTQVAQTRVVNGYATTIEHFPWIVSMQYYGSHRCGGSIITTNRILTAAHCTISIVASSLSIRAGSTDSQTGGELVAVTEYTNHQSYNPTTLENDISVMVLATRLTSGSTIAVIPLPMHGSNVPDGVVANVAGWGALCEKCPGIATLQYVGLPVLSNAQCSSMYGDTVTPGMLCAGFVEGGRDACQGDSGGPLNNGNLLIGVVSWGDGCARPNSPGVFTRVASYRNWINGLL